MTDIKVGDVIVFTGKDQSNELSIISPMDFSTGFVESTDCYRKATPAEIAAGHRIDEQQEFHDALAVAKENLSKLEPWRKEALAAAFNADSAIFATVHDGKKEAVTGSRSEFEACPVVHAQLAEFDRDSWFEMVSPTQYILYRTEALWQLWQHQQAVVDRLMREVPGSCAWNQDEEGIYDTACGNKFWFADGGPNDNEFKFCCYCGAKLKEISHD